MVPTCFCGGTAVVLQDTNGTEDKQAMSLLCEAYWRLGKALLAENDHPDRNCRGAAKAFAKALGEGWSPCGVPAMVLLRPCCATLCWSQHGMAWHAVC